MIQPIIPAGRFYALRFHMATIARTGPFATGRPKIVWHTTQSPAGRGVEEISKELRAKEFEPHLVLDPDSRWVQQLIRLDEYARALQHPEGTPETNKAHAIQIEVTGMAGQSWSPRELESMAMLACLIEHRTPRRIPRRSPIFSNIPHRMGATNFTLFGGHCGHEHVPNQPAGHWDPGAFPINQIFTLMKHLDAKAS